MKLGPGNFCFMFSVVGIPFANVWSWGSEESSTDIQWLDPGKYNIPSNETGSSTATMDHH